MFPRPADARGEHSDGRPQPDGDLETGIGYGRRTLLKMFLPELAHRPVKLAGVADAPLRAFALEMDDGHIGKIIIRIPGFPKPVAEIDVFRIEEKALVEGARLFKYLAADPKT